MPSSTRERHDVRGERLEHRRVEVAARRRDRVPGGHDARAVDPADVDRLLERDVEQQPPVFTNRPRLRTVVNPARSVRRALATARSVRSAGSSCTGLSGLSWFGPAEQEVDLHVHQPGQQREVAEVDLDRVVGHRGRGDRRRCGRPRSSELARFDELTRGDVDATRALRRWIGGCGVRGRAMLASDRGLEHRVEGRRAAVGHARLTPRPRPGTTRSRARSTARAGAWRRRAASSIGNCSRYAIASSMRGNAAS